MPFVADTQEDPVQRRTSGFVPDPPAPTNWFDRLKTTAGDAAQSLSDAAGGVIDKVLPAETYEGRPVVKEPDGKWAHEKSMTIEAGGQHMNIPTMFGGKSYEPDQAVQIMRKNNWIDPDTGRPVPTFKSQAEAVSAAQAKEAQQQNFTPPSRFDRATSAISENIVNPIQQAPGKIADRLGTAFNQEAADAGKLVSGVLQNPKVAKGIEYGLETASHAAPFPGLVRTAGEYLAGEPIQPRSAGELANPMPDVISGSIKIATDAVRKYVSPEAAKLIEDTLTTAPFLPKGIATGIRQIPNLARYSRGVKAEPEATGFANARDVTPEAPRALPAPGEPVAAKPQTVEEIIRPKEVAPVQNGFIPDEAVKPGFTLEPVAPAVAEAPKAAPAPYGIQPRGFVADEISTAAPVARETVQPINAPRAPELPASDLPVPERFQQTAPTESLKTKPMKTIQGEIGAAVERNIQQVTQSEGNLEYKGKEYEGAVREGNNLRLKDSPDKVISNPAEMLKVEEKVPFDVPGETTAKPMFEQTPAGQQAVIPGAEARSVPNAPLRAKRAQTEAPLALEQPGLAAKEPGLFAATEQLKSEPSPDIAMTKKAAPERPIPSKNLSPEEIAAADEMRGILGAKKKPVSNGRSVKEILQSEEGSIKMGPLRMRDGKPVEAPTADEAKVALDELTKPVSSMRLIRGGLTEESSKTLAKTMGPEGAELAKLSKAVRNDSELEASQAYQPIKAQLKNMDAKQRANLVEVLEGKSGPVDEAVKAAATATRIELNKVADRAAQVGLEIKNPVTGEKYPFQPRENFFPHMFGKEMGQIARDPKGRAMLKEKIKANLERAGKEIDEVAVEKALATMIKASKTRYGHLEMARIADLGDYSKDAGAVLSRYFADAYRRVNIAEKFGPDLSGGENLLSQIGLNKGDKAESFARSYFQKVTSTEPEGNAVVKDAVRTATNFQAFSKLGQAVISNISQPAYTAIVAGAKNAAKGYGAAMTKEGRSFADKIILSDTMTDFLKDTGEHIDRSTMGKAADTVLKRTGFSAVERMNRIVSANAGKFFAEDTFEKLLKKPDSERLRYHLEKMNVDVEAALERGELSEKDLLRAGQNIVNRTQFKTDVTEIPLFWASDAGRLLTQFKKFQFKAGQMMKDEVLGEMKRGNAKPFIRAALILPIAGALTVAAKDAVRFGDQTERDRNLADYLAAVGTFGSFTDAFANSGRQPVKGLKYLAGPTLGDAGDLWEALLIEAPSGNLLPTAKFAARQVPVAGPSIRQLFNNPKKEPKSSAQNSQLLKELGIDSPLQRNQNKQMLKDLGIGPQSKNESTTGDGLVQKLASFLTPNEASAEVIPLDEQSKRYAEELRSGKHGETAQQTYNLAHALNQPVEVASGGKHWAEAAKYSKQSVEELNNSNLMGFYEQKKPRPSGAQGVALNPNLEQFKGAPALTLAHELGHFLDHQAGTINPGNSMRNESVADSMAGTGDPSEETVSQLIAIIKALIDKEGAAKAKFRGADIGARAGRRAAEESKRKY